MKYLQKDLTIIVFLLLLGIIITPYVTAKEDKDNNRLKPLKNNENQEQLLEQCFL